MYHRRRRDVGLGRAQAASTSAPAIRSCPTRAFTVMANPDSAAGQGVGQPHRLRARRRDRAPARGRDASRTRCSPSRRCRRRSVCAAPRPRRSRCSPTSRSRSTSGIAHDTPGTEGDEKLGGGPLIVVYDATSIPEPRPARPGRRHRRRSSKLPLQFESVERGGTDAGRIHVTGAGRAVACRWASPARYIHSHVSIIDRRDFDSHAVKLLVALVKRLDRDGQDA